jgi:LacI family transcriptional regulator
MYMSYYYSTDLHRGVAQYALEADWCLNASMYRGGSVPNFHWDGIVGCFQEQDEFFETFVKPKQIPAVSLTVTSALPCVLPNHRSIGTLGAEYLVELGYKNFAFFFQDSSMHELLRAEAFQERLNPAIHRFHKINHTGTPRVQRQSAQTRLRVLRRWLRELPKPVAVMAPIDDLAIEVIELCADMGLHVPKEVGVLGVNNDRLLCDLAHVPLSSVDNNEYKVGYEGAALLDRLMSGGRPPPRPVIIEPKGVVTRKSTDLLDVAEVPDREVAKAVRFIAERYTAAIRTADVAREAGLCMRAIQVRFACHMGRGIHDYIAYKRIEHAKRLLRNTNFKTATIAEESGFASRERFSKAFKRETGMNPAEFRKADS